MKQSVKTVNAPQAIGPYNQAIISENLIFTSGQIPLTKDGKIISDKIEEQTQQCLNNIEQILIAAGSDKTKILKTTIFLKNIDDFVKVNDIYSNFLDDCIFPARTTVEISRLPKEALIEIEAIARC